ncbi:aspartate aminotransferase family protein [Pontibacterium sp.]|jgi:acetylornithine/N-succinyldiaminopimelate aminotransferase|uniref:aspartate aminotransferase family protein n=1 Tax=Pontibacterium sp. TaxID=2036026 RepID=UPI003562A876
MAHELNRHTFDAVMVPNYAPGAVIPVRGEGSHIWDQDGRSYIDFAGGIAVNSLGHCHPELVKVLTDQANKLWHLSNVWTNEPALKLAQQLCQMTFADKVYFANSGAEANEAALKLARRYSVDKYSADKHQIIAFDNAFHGRTFFTVSVGGQPKYSEGFGPVPEGISHLPFNDIQALEKAISHHTCAVIMEPIQGEAGILPADPDFIRRARELCNQYNALLIFDEIQTGVGRTGELYAYMRTGVKPDILTTAKALGGGFPIGAMLCTDEVAQAMAVGTHGSTYGGNPLGCRVASRVLELVNDRDLLDGVRERHLMFMDGLDELNDRYHLFSDIRGQGLLIGCQLCDQWQGQARNLLVQAQDAGVMVLIAGPDVLRLAPSLIIPPDDIHTGLERLGQAMVQFLHTRTEEA